MSDSEQEVVVRKRRKVDPEDRQYRPHDDQKVPKKPKPFGAPKRPLSSFMLFMAAKRASYKSSNPDAKPTEIMKGLSEKWKTASDSEKNRHDKEAKKLREQYKKDRKKYEASSKYRRYKRELAEWNDLYKEEWEEQEEEKKKKREEAKNRPKKKKVAKKTADKKKKKKKT